MQPRRLRRARSAALLERGSMSQVGELVRFSKQCIFRSHGAQCREVDCYTKVVPKNWKYPVVYTRRLRAPCNGQLHSYIQISIHHRPPPHPISTLFAIHKSIAPPSHPKVVSENWKCPNYKATSPLAMVGSISIYKYPSATDLLRIPSLLYLPSTNPSHPITSGEEGKR
jgi:hypothetical protein